MRANRLSKAQKNVRRLERLRMLKGTFKAEYKHLDVRGPTKSYNVRKGWKPKHDNYIEALQALGNNG